MSLSQYFIVTIGILGGLKMFFIFNLSIWREQRILEGVTYYSNNFLPNKLRSVESC